MCTLIHVALSNIRVNLLRLDQQFIRTHSPEPTKSERPTKSSMYKSPVHREKAQYSLTRKLPSLYLVLGSYVYYNSKKYLIDVL